MTGLEEAFTGAAETLSRTALGSVIVIGIMAFAITVRMLRQDIKALQDDLRKEREDHQKTREAQMTDIRNMAHVAASVEGLRSTVERLVDFSLVKGRE